MPRPLGGGQPWNRGPRPQPCMSPAMGVPGGMITQPGFIGAGMISQSGILGQPGMIGQGLAGVPAWAVPAPPVQHPPPPSSLAGPIQTTSSPTTIQRLPLDTRFIQNSGTPAPTSTVNAMPNMQGPMYPPGTLAGGAGTPFQGYPFGPPPPQQFGAAPTFQTMPQQAWPHPWTQQQ